MSAPEHAPDYPPGYSGVPLAVRATLSSRSLAPWPAPQKRRKGEGRWE